MLASLLLATLPGCAPSRLAMLLEGGGGSFADSMIAGDRTPDGATDSDAEPRQVELGRSVAGAPIVMQVFGDGPERILVVGGIHGDEPTGADLATRLVRTLRENPAQCHGRTIAILPQANPDGLLRGQRGNANGVDLNRNFPSLHWRPAQGNGLSHGSEPASEPETRAVLRAFAMIRPQRVVDIHSIPGGYHCNNYDGPAGGLAEVMSWHNGYPVIADIGYPTPGAFGCWVGIDRDVPAITLELPRKLSGDECWAQNADALLAFLAADSVDGADSAVVKTKTKPARRIARVPQPGPTRTRQPSPAVSAGD
jgi:predicted deacylase